MTRRVGKVVAEEVDRLTVIDQKEVRIAVVIVVAHNDGATSPRVIDAAAGRGVGEGGPVAIVMVKQVRLGIAVGRAIRLQRPGGDAEVEEAVQVVIEKDGAPS